MNEEKYLDEIIEIEELINSALLEFAPFAPAVGVLCSVITTKIQALKTKRALSKSSFLNSFSPSSPIFKLIDEIDLNFEKPIIDREELIKGKIPQNLSNPKMPTAGDIPAVPNVKDVIPENTIDPNNKFYLDAD